MNTFFTKSEFRDNIRSEVNSAIEVYQRRKADGMKDYSISAYDFVFISDTKNKLEDLGTFLSEKYGYSIEGIIKEADGWEMTGNATEFPVDEDNLIYWVLHLYCKGYDFDCRLVGYGSLDDNENQRFPKMDISFYDDYFNLAMANYENGNMGLGIVNFSIAIKINPNDPDAWYSRAILKEEVYEKKAARADYDKALELAPDFVDAIINRAANKDEAGEYEDAIEDYTTAIALDPDNGVAYFNRGNSKLNSGDKKGACEDWHKAKELGSTYAQSRIDASCEKK